MRTKHSEYATAQPESDQRLELAMRDVGDLTDVDVVEVCIHDNTGGRFVWLNKGLASELAAALLEWTKPGWFGRAEKWENTAREATAELRKVKEELRCAENRVESYRKGALELSEQRMEYKRQVRDLESKLAQALDRSAIIANDYIQLRKVAEHNEKVMDQAIGELKRMAKEAGIELPTPAGQLAACEVSPPAKPLAYMLPPCKENGNANFLLFTYPDCKLVFDGANQGVVIAEVHKRGYDLLAPWDRRHPINIGPVPAYPVPEEGSSETAPVRPFKVEDKSIEATMAIAKSVRQRPGNILRIKSYKRFGHQYYSLYTLNGEPIRVKDRQQGNKFTSLDETIAWCNVHDFDYRH